MARRFQDVDSGQDNDDMFAQDVDEQQDNDDMFAQDIDSDPLDVDVDVDVDYTPPPRRAPRGRQSRGADVGVEAQGEMPASRSRRERAQDVRELGTKPQVGFSVRKERSRSTGQEVYRILLNGRPIPTSVNPEGRYALTYEAAVAQTYSLNPKTGKKITPWNR